MMTYENPIKKEKIKNLNNVEGFTFEKSNDDWNPEFH
jgi:hypothetical protein